MARSGGSLRAAAHDAALFAYGINTINTVISTRFAASLGNASVSHFYYANRLKELVLGGFAVSLADGDPAASRPGRRSPPDRGPFKANLAFALRLLDLRDHPGDAWA